MPEYELIPVIASDAGLQGVLRNLTRMYCYEWSQYILLDVDDEGVYIFEKYLPNYWTSADCKAFMLKCGGAWAGFALLDKDFVLHKDYDYSMAEFFVMYKYRKQGAGRWMATSLFDLLPGKWELGRNPKNLTTYRFWERLISDYTGGSFELKIAVPEHKYIDGTLGDVFAFDAPPKN